MTEPAQPPADDVAVTADGPVWQTGKNGRQYVSNPAGGWPIWRRGDETIAEALQRASEGKADKPPISKSKREKAQAKAEPSVSRDQVTRKIQTMCEDVLTAPAIGCAMIGDEWGADHFTVQGQRFAAQLARSSEHNPWLRQKLEAGLDGERNVMAIITSVSLVAGAVGYLAPPLIKYLNLPVPDRGKLMLGVPIDGPPPPPSAGYQGVPATDQAQAAAEAFAAAAAMQAAAEMADQARMAGEDPAPAAADGEAA